MRSRGEQKILKFVYFNQNQKDGFAERFNLFYFSFSLLGTFPIRTEPAWKLRLKPSHSERKPVLCSGTYMGRDDCLRMVRFHNQLQIITSTQELTYVGRYSNGTTDYVV